MGSIVELDFVTEPYLRFHSFFLSFQRALLHLQKFWRGAPFSCGRASGSLVHMYLCVWC